LGRNSEVVDDFEIDPDFEEEFGLKEEMMESEEDGGGSEASDLSEDEDNPTKIANGFLKAALKVTDLRKNAEQGSSTAGNRTNAARKKRKGKWRPTFTCDLCDLKFKTREEKFTHDETVHLSEETVDDSVEASMLLYSRICGKAAMTPRDLSTHNEAFHVSHLKFLCLSCVPPRKFFSKETLEPHYVVHSPTGPYTCQLCTGTSPPVTFDLPTQLDNHLLRVHTHLTEFPKKPEVKTTSEECKNDLRKLYEVRRAKKAAIRESQLQCRFCSVEKAHNLYGVKAHERKEHGDKFIHLCTHPECGDCFTDANELRTCQESHKEKTKEGESFKCFVCYAR